MNKETLNRRAINVLFDLDGTLTDPGDGFVESITYALTQLECPVPPASEIRRYVGPPLGEALSTFLGKKHDLLPNAVTLYRQRYGATGFLENAIYPGIEAALATLKSDGVVLFVATSKPLIFANQILEHFKLSHFFRGIYGSELDGTLANKVHLIAHLLRVEELDPASTFMVGDRAQDMSGALANGVVPIGALWGYGSNEELAKAGAAALCEHASRLPAILASTV